MFSNTFAGIAPASVPGFVAAELVGGAVAIVVLRVLYPDITPEEAADTVMPHGEDLAHTDTPLEPVPANTEA
jgi:hypothetical protein